MSLDDASIACSRMRVAKELVVGALALALTAAVCASFSSCAADDASPLPPRAKERAKETAKERAPFEVECLDMADEEDCSAPVNVVLDFDDASHADLINDERVIDLVAQHLRE